MRLFLYLMLILGAVSANAAPVVVMPEAVMLELTAVEIV